MVIAIVAVLIAVSFVAVGQGGGMSVEQPDYAPLDLGPVSATDVALLRPPGGLWGYSVQATDEALARIAQAIRQRDIRIVALEQLVADLSREPSPPAPLSSPPYFTARHRRDADGPFGAGDAGEPGDGPFGPLGPPEQARG